MKSFKFLIITSVFCFSLLPRLESLAQGVLEETTQHSKVKLMAFEVLQTKCNTCHKWINPSKVFTLDNMDDFSQLIHKQVFVFKRMPKGRKRKQKMREEEYQILKIWIAGNLKQF